jgi:POT family proton-dependent oligopeptide transporter
MFLHPLAKTVTLLLLFTLVVFILLIYRLPILKITKRKLIAVTFFAFLTIFFWAIFEQSQTV